MSKPVTKQAINLFGIFLHISGVKEARLPKLVINNRNKEMFTDNIFIDEFFFKSYSIEMVNLKYPIHKSSIHTELLCE